VIFKQFDKGECLYANLLAVQENIADWKLEGRAKISFEHN
jgi:hypothetical protein